MAVFSYGMGKGLRESAYPFREDYIFGAEFGDFDATYFTSKPIVLGATTHFDLSLLTPGHEVVVALLNIDNASTQLYNITFKWYRERDNALLYEFSVSTNRQAWGGTFAYSYIGYVGWEIIENGDYTVRIDVTGAESFTKVIAFTVSGIPVEEPEPTPSESFLPSIIGVLDSVSESLYIAYEEVNSWVYPFYLLATPLYYISIGFFNLAFYFGRFNDWIIDATDKVKDILNLAEIIQALKTWLDYATWAWDWVRDAWWYVEDILEDWWRSVTPTIHSWISDLEEWTALQLNSLMIQINNIQANVNELLAQIPDVSELIAWFSNWWSNILANLTGWWNEKLLDINSLFSSWTLELEPFWAGWQDIRDKVFEFFDDPLEWLLVRFTDWFLGPEV